MAVNTLGRVILTGPRGGEYVLNASGRKIRKFKRAPAAPPAAAPPAAASPKNIKGRKIFTDAKGEYVLGPSGRKVRKFTRPRVATPVARSPAAPPNAPKNTKGRVIYKGPKGGEYVLGPGGRKIYKFTRGAAPPKPMTPPAAAAPSPPKLGMSGVSKKVTNKLHTVIRNIRRRESYIFPVKKTTTVKHNYIKFNSSGEMKRAPKQITTTINTYDFPVTNRKVVLAHHPTNFDPEWFRAQSDYVNSLNEYDYMTLSAYTVQSHTWIGPYLLRGTVGRPIIHRTGMMTPLFPQFVFTDLIRLTRLSTTDPHIAIMRDPKASVAQKYKAYIRYLPTMDTQVLEMCLKKYKDDLKRIIDGAPPVKKTIYVYRGTSRDIFAGAPGHVHTMKSFSSTAFNIKHAGIYASSGFMRIALRPGTRAILAAGVNQWDARGEYEIILNIGTRFYISKRNVKRAVPIARGYPMQRVTDVSVYPHK